MRQAGRSRYRATLVAVLTITLGAAGAAVAVIVPAFATVTQVNCASQDLQTAINGAVSGDTLAITGTCSKAPSGTDPAAYLISGKNLTLQGASGAMIEATSSGHVLKIAAGSTVVLKGLTISFGSSALGGGIINGGNSTLHLDGVTLDQDASTNQGGGIYNDLGSTLSMTDVTMSSDTALDQGGGLENLGTATIADSMFVADDAQYNGGAIDNMGAAASLTVTNSTFYANDTTRSSLFEGGGALYIHSGTVTLTNATLVANGSANLGGAFVDDGGAITIRGSIISGNMAYFPTDPDCSWFGGTISSGGYNMIGVDTCVLANGTTDVIGANLHLGTLADNGGPTQTIGLQTGSPAIDAIPGSVCATFLGASPTDQRGVIRPQGAGCDVGAFETAPDPVALDDYYNAHQDVALTQDTAHGVLANDSTTSGGALSSTVASGPAHGSLSLGPSGSFTYTPASGFTGTDSFTYKAMDSATTQSATGSVQITVVATALNPPAITSISPASGTAGTNVTITGSSFAGLIAVTFSGVPAVVDSASPTSITATVPATAPTGRVVVTTNQGSATSLGNFAVTSPTITKLTPASGTAGATLTITGMGFTGATQVSFGGTAQSPVTTTPTTISVLVPAGALSGPIAVSTPHGSGTSATTFTVLAPSVASFAPVKGAPGVKVTITGKGFLGATKVTFNGVPAGILTVSATKITVDVPLFASSGKIAVTTPDGTAVSSGTFKVT